MLALERIAIVAHIFRVAQIPIAERAAPSAHFTRGFVPWRLSDDGPGASRTVSMAVIRNPSQWRTCSADLKAIDGRTMKEPMNALPILS